MLKVRCSFCGKDILFEYQDEVIKDGKITGKCGRCGTFSEFNTTTKSFTKAEKNDKIIKTK